MGIDISSVCSISDGLNVDGIAFDVVSVPGSPSLQVWPYLKSEMTTDGAWGKKYQSILRV